MFLQANYQAEQEWRITVERENVFIGRIDSYCYGAGGGVGRNGTFLHHL
jgi:hypothetical protein